ncbi:hypothetical protein LD13_gp156 [Bacillus phage Bobb]|uniref:Uncharacterized protein n=1 Tax=Bacillus phage Bobb TaxID=1527469 RepID=A0A076G6Y8_9CAUD|nr:hypothetical protein LD13_gp156 [Bacillus phage Bobb]AII28057.1 hypothetical protein [Bacillus phage Bobb]
MTKRRYRKTAIVEAVQWTGTSESIEELKEFAGDDILIGEQTHDLIIHTLEGDMLAHLGDYILKGIEGELWACKERVFKQTYEEVKEEPN